MSIKEYEITQMQHNGVAVSASFLINLFNLEKDYNDGQTFTIVKNGKIRERYLSKVTRTDIITTIFLYATCNTNGCISDTTIHNLYKSRIHLFAVPISYSEFKHSLKKFEVQGLIDVRENMYTGRSTIQLNHFKQENGKLERYVILHPIVFTETFLTQSIDYWKLYLIALLQIQKSKQGLGFFRKFDNKLSLDQEHTDFYKSGLKQLLHKQENSDVRRVIDQLMTIQYEGKPLFTRVPGKEVIKKRGRAFDVVHMKIHDDFIVQDDKGNYRLPLKQPERYKKVATLIDDLLYKANSLDLKELLLDYDGKLLNDLLYILKGRSKTHITYAIETLIEYWKDTKQLPSDLQQFVLSLVKRKSEAQYMKIAKEEGIYAYLAHRKTGEELEEAREQFLSTMSFHSKRIFKVMCRETKPLLDKFFSTEEFTEKDYEGSADLNHLKGIDLVRQIACKKKIDPVAYQALENQALEWLESETEDGIVSMILNELEPLKRAQTVPALPWKFDLAQYMKDHYKKYNLKFS